MRHVGHSTYHQEINQNINPHNQEKVGKTHSEAPESRIATCTKAYNLYFMLVSETKPIVEKKINCPCAEVGAYVDQWWTGLL
jgi:hypothetical protein